MPGLKIGELEAKIPIIQGGMSEQDFNKKIPVIAAGGIYTGADIYKFIQLGAQGVQMGTRFVATNECNASIKFKEAYVKKMILL